MKDIGILIGGILTAIFIGLVGRDIIFGQIKWMWGEPLPKKKKDEEIKD